MADRSKCDLPYGQYGHIEYLPENKCLSFERRVRLPNVVSALGETKVIEKPFHAGEVLNRNVDGEPKSKRHARQIKALVEALPEFEPAVDLLPPLLQVSETADDAQSFHDPSAGSIIAFANIRSQVRHRAVPVVAARTGATGRILRVAQLQTRRHGWAEDKSTWLDMPILGGGQTTWNSPAGTIQQLLFAEDSGHGDSLLAVRLASKVVIFRVAILKGSTKVGTPSGLKLEVVFQSHSDLPPARSYMDVAFNPWFSQQIAVIDSGGEWQVLEISSKKDGQACVVCGSTSQVGNEDAIGNDGWARIAWVSDVATLATCTRQRLVVHSIRDAEATMLREVPLHLVGGLPWVLGFMRSPRNMQSLAVLTSTHLLIYRITRTELEGVHVSSELRIHHYQNSEDLSLRIISYTDNEDIALGIYSGMHSTMSMHHLSESLAGRTSSSDPYSFAVPHATAKSSSAESIRDLCIRPLRLRHKHGTDSSNDRGRSSDAVQYYTLTVIRGNGIIEETLCHIQANTDSSSTHALTAPSWIAKPALKITKLSSLDAMLDESALELHDFEQERVEPVALRARRRRENNISQQGFLDLEALADALNQPSTPDQTLAAAMTRIKALTAQTALDSHDPAPTLAQLLDSELLVDEVERASAEVEDLFSKFARASEDAVAEPASRLHLEAISLPSCTHLSHDPEVVTVFSAYEQIVSSWISALPGRIAGRVRLAKRERACRVAVELMLASRRLRPARDPDNRASQDSVTGSHDRVEAWDLPVRATRTELHALPSSSALPDPATQPSSLPTPSPTTTPSIATASSRMSTATPQLDRLAAYTSFTKPTPLVLPRPLNNVLSHWEVESDPNDYDWMSKSRHISQVDDDETQGLTGKERQRAQRQAERHLRRQRKEAAASQAAQLASSQAVDIISTSQHSLAKPESQQIGTSKSSQPDSQSQSQGRDVVASQILRGRHGGRPLKKRRKDGF